MQFKVSSFDLKLSRAQRISAALIGAFLGVAVCAKLATAQVEHVFTPGQTLTAADLNENFNGLDTRVSQLEAAPTVLEASSDTTEAGNVSENLVVQGMSLDLTPGTWRVDAFASVGTSVNPDSVQIGLWNATTDTEIQGARSPMAVSTSLSSNPLAPCDGTTTFCTTLAMTTTKIITVSTTTKIRLAAFRNGLSRVVLASGNSALSAGHRLLATKLH
ncbi:MAG: hypothetical protein U0271_33935 [Polyangiaceae bacterium]